MTSAKAQRGVFATMIAHPVGAATAVAIVLGIDVLATKAVLAAEGRDVVSNSTSVAAVLGILLMSMAVMRTLIHRHLATVRARKESRRNGPAT
jgi:uncharacterized membrane protein (DUF485 family)